LIHDGQELPMSAMDSEAVKGLKPGPAAVEKRQPDSSGLKRRTCTVEQAGHILGISRATAYARARDGSIPTIRIGKRLLVIMAALNKIAPALEAAE
jgi:excisionase family DNA binding protein